MERKIILNQGLKLNGRFQSPIRMHAMYSRQKKKSLHNISRRCTFLNEKSGLSHTISLHLAEDVVLDYIGHSNNFLNVCI